MGLISLHVFEQVHLLREEHTARHHHVHDAAERPPVDFEAIPRAARPRCNPRAIIVERTSNELGGGVTWRKHCIAGVALAANEAGGVVYECGAQVRDPHVPGTGEKDVFWLEIAVHDAHVVKSVETERLRKFGSKKP